MALSVYCQKNIIKSICKLIKSSKANKLIHIPCIKKFIFFAIAFLIFKAFKSFKTLENLIILVIRALNTFFLVVFTRNQFINKNL